MNLTGRCLCGAVAFTAVGVEEQFHACHCDMCRRWSGGPVLGISVEGVEFEGEDKIARYPSSEWAARGFCNICGSSLFYHLRQPNKYILCLGSFDDQSALRLAGEIYVDAKPEGYCFAGDHPRQTEKQFLATIGMG
ncbi:MAG: GFA family protein [Pseudomonadota bacterium]